MGGRALLAGGMAIMICGTVGAGCNRGSTSGQATGDAPAASTSSQAQTADRGGGYGGGYADAADRPPVPLFHGEPMWSENRSHSAKENAEYHFQRTGPDLGAKTLDDFLTKVHRFGDHPPAGTLKLVRANGDKLLYDPHANLFGVFTREGAPRTVFKPNNGMAYWQEQKTREAQGESGYGSGRSRSYGGGGNGGGNGERGSGASGDESGG